MLDSDAKDASELAQLSIHEADLKSAALGRFKCGEGKTRTTIISSAVRQSDSDSDSDRLHVGLIRRHESPGLGGKQRSACAIKDLTARRTLRPRSEPRDQLSVGYYGKDSALGTKQKPVQNTSQPG